MKKTFSKTGETCRVTFELAPEHDANSISLLGDFNDWNPETHEMKKRKSGKFSVTVSLSAGSEYRFRYLVDETDWENDHEADKYVPNTFGTTDLVVAL